MKAEAYYSLGCFFFTEAVLRRKRYSECRQVADDSLCPSGVSCDEQTGLCKKPLCPRNARMTSQAELPPDPGTARRPSAAIATGPSRVRAELNRHEPALTRSLGRVAKLFDRKPTAARQRALASALDGYRRDFDALIVDVEQIGKADPSASSAAKATLTTLRHASSGLEDFAEALRAAVTSKAISRGTRGKRSFAKAAASSGKARRLLGCGDAC